MKSNQTSTTRRAGGLRFWRNAVLAVLMAGSLRMACAQQPPKPGDLEKIRAALPEKPVVAPKQARTILVYSKAEGFVHGCIPWAKETLRLMAEKTGAFKAEFNDDKDTVFKAETLAKYDALALNNTSGPKLTPEQKKALLDYVSNGGGIIALHAATDAFSPDDECAKMLGGVFDGHPWGAGGTWTLKPDDAKHPLNRAFNGQSFKLRDEIYQFKAPYSRDVLKVLVVLDWEAPENQKVNGVNRADKDFAAAWIREYGKGRVFASAFGHNAEVYFRTDILTHWLDGIQYALGDLKADATPSAKKPSACLPAVAPVVWCAEGAQASPQDAVNALAVFTYEQDRGIMMKAEQAARDANRQGPAAVAALEQMMLAALARPDATVDGKGGLLRVLRTVASKASVPVVAPLLKDPALSHMARYALEGTEGREVDEAFRSALAQAPEAQKVGLVASLGVRRDARSLYTFNQLTASPNGALARAALVALGRLGSREAAAALEKAKVAPELEALRWDALLACADGMVRDRDTRRAGQIYARALAGMPARARSGALIGLAAVDADAALPEALKALAGEDAAMRQAALNALEIMPAKATAEPLTKGLATWADPVKEEVLGLLERKNVVTALPAILPLIDSEKDSLRAAAVRAAGVLAPAAQAERLWSLDAKGGETARAASDALVRAKEPSVAQFLKMKLGSQDSNDRRRAIELLARRGDRALVPQLLNEALYEDETVGRGAAQALRDLATEAHLPVILDLAARKVPAAKRRPLEATAGALVQNLFDKEACVRALIGAYPVADAQGRQMLLVLLGRLPHADSLPILTEALKDGDAAIRRSAVTGFSTWNNSVPSASLAELAGGEADEAVRAAAVRVAAELLGRDHPRKAEDRAAELGALMKRAKTTEDRRVIIRALSETRHPTAVPLIEACKGDADLAKDIEEALARMK